MVNFKKFLVAAMFCPILAGAEILSNDGTTATFSIMKPAPDSKSFEIDSDRALNFWINNLEKKHPNDEIYVMDSGDGGIIVSAGGDKQKATISLVDEEYDDKYMNYGLLTNIEIRLIPCESDCGKNIVGREKNDYRIVQKFDRIDAPLRYVVNMREPKNSPNKKYHLTFSNYSGGARIAKIIKLSENSVKISIK